MADKSKIEWCDATWNPITGCTPISKGCRHCYAARMVNRLPALHGYPLKYVDSEEPQREPTPFSRLVFHPERLETLLHWKKPRRIFVGSMTDMFHENMSLKWLDRVMYFIDRCPQHTFLFLTKRPEHMKKYFRSEYPGVWLGVTVESSAHLDRIDVLRTIPAVKRFVSFEPLLEPITGVNLCGIDWVIVGCETGPGARRMDLSWAWNLRVNAYQYRRSFFMKKATPRDKSIDDLPEDLRIREIPR